MARAIFLVGLCGAGKSRLGRTMARGGLQLVENLLHQPGGGNIDLVNNPPANYMSLVSHLNGGRDCVIEEFQTITPQGRAALKASLEQRVNGVTVEFWFFEKDIVKLTHNVLSRPDDKKKIADHLLINGRHFDNYTLPDPPYVLLPVDPPSPYED